MLSQGSQGAPWKLLWLLGVPTDCLSAANQEDKTVPHSKIKWRKSKLLDRELYSEVMCACVCVCERERGTPFTVQRPPATAKLVNKFLLLTNIRTF